MLMLITKGQCMETINREELKPIFGSYKDMYALTGRTVDSYMLKTGIWDEEGNLTGKTPAERFSRVSVLITAYICHKGSLKGIPNHWLNYAKQQKI